MGQKDFGIGFPLLLAGLLAGLLGVLTSCKAVANYGEDRCADLADCFALIVAPGTAPPLSGSIGLEVTNKGPLGLGYSRGRAYGAVGRRFGGFDYGLVNPSLLYSSIDWLLELDPDTCDDPESNDSSVERFADEDLYFTTQLRPEKALGRNKGREYRLGVDLGLSIFFIYADIEFGEIADFLLGIAGFDIMDDDANSRSQGVGIYPSDD